MISNEFCGKQLSRLAHLDRFPRTKAAVEDMVCALQAAETEASVREWWASQRG